MKRQCPEELAENVCDEESFIAFLEALASDFALERQLETQDTSSPYSSGKLGWQNGSVDAVLECASAYASDSKKNWSNEGDSSIWKRCAEILLMGKHYE